MDAVTEVQPSPPQADGEGDATEEKTAAAVEAFAQDREGLIDADERDALDWLLSGAQPLPYQVPFEWDTPAGMLPAKWIVKAMDGRVIDNIEQRNVSEATNQIDAITANCQLVAEASIGIEGRPGHIIELDSEEFRTVMVRREGEPTAVPHVFPSAADAIEARFRRQMGVVAGVASQVRRISGYDAERVGKAQRRGAVQQRRATAAVGNS